MTTIIETKVREISDELIKIRRDLHKIPEIEFDLPETSMYVQNKLDEYGIDYQVIAKTAITGVIYGGREGKTVLLRADMDALPIEERTNLPFCSIHAGCMHACGHDVHMTCLLGALKILNNIKDTLCGNVRFVFQPAEEGDGGAQIMIDAGVMEEPHVDAAFALHVEPFEQAGNIQLKQGAVMASPDNFEFTIFGKGGHGAYPHKCVNPIVVASMITSAFQTVVSQKINPLTPCVVSVCDFHAGTYPNIIPDTAYVQGTARSFDLQTRQCLANTLEKIAVSIAQSMNARCEFRFIPLYPPVVNDDNMNMIVRNAAKKLAYVYEIIDLQEPSMAGDDFSYFAQLVPSSYFKLGIGNKDILNKPLHHAEFMVNEKAIATGCAVLAQSAYDFLNN